MPAWGRRAAVVGGAAGRRGGRRRRGPGRRAVRRRPLVPQRRGPGGRRAVRRAARHRRPGDRRRRRRAARRGRRTAADGTDARPTVTVVFCHGLALEPGQLALPAARPAPTWAGWCSGTSAGTAGPAAGAHGARHHRPARPRPARRARGHRAHRAGRARRPLDGRHDDHGAGRRSTPSCSATGSSAWRWSPPRRAGWPRSRFGVPAAAGRALRRAAPRALAALNRRPALVAAARRLGADLEFVLTKRYSFATDVPPSLVRFVARDARQHPAGRDRRAVPGLRRARQARRARRPQRRRDADPGRRAGRDDPGRPQPRDGRARCRAPSWRSCPRPGTCSCSSTTTS